MWTDSDCFDLKLMRASACVNGFYKRMLAPSGITAGQYRILRHIDASSGGSVQAVADHMGVDRSTLARTVKPLVTAGLVADERTAGCRDRKLVLTESGRTVLAQARSLWSEAQDLIAEKLGNTGMKELSDVLQMLSEIK